MISIAFQSNIGYYLFNYLLAHWLSSIRGDTVNLPQHPLLPLPNTIHEGRPFLPEETWTGWWPMNATTQTPLSPLQIQTNTVEFLSLNGYFERTDIVPSTYWDTFLPVLCNSLQFLHLASLKYEFIAFLRHINLPPATPNCSEVADRDVAYLKQAILHYAQIYGGNVAIVILSCPVPQRAKFKNTFPDNVPLIFIDSTYELIHIMRSARAALIPECSSLWWIAMLSPELRYLHITLDAARQTRKKLLRYSPRYGLNLMLNSDTVQHQLPIISKCSLKQ